MRAREYSRQASTATCRNSLIVGLIPSIKLDLTQLACYGSDVHQATAGRLGDQTRAKRMDPSSECRQRPGSSRPRQAPSGWNEIQITVLDWRTSTIIQSMNQARADPVSDPRHDKRLTGLREATHGL